jgi:hypothetical protein
MNTALKAKEYLRRLKKNTKNVTVKNTISRGAGW